MPRASDGAKATARRGRERAFLIRHTIPRYGLVHMPIGVSAPVKRTENEKKKKKKKRVKSKRGHDSARNNQMLSSFQAVRQSAQRRLHRESAASFALFSSFMASAVPVASNCGPSAM